MSVTTKMKATSRAGWSVWVLPALVVLVFAVTTVRLWPSTAPRKATLRWALGTEHDGEATSIVFSPNSKLIATGASDGTLLIRDARTGAVDKRRAPAPGPPEPATPLGFSGEKSLVFANIVDPADRFLLPDAWSVTELNIADGTSRKCYAGSWNEKVLRLLADGRTLAVHALTLDPPEIKHIDIENKKLITNIIPARLGLSLGTTLVVSADGKTFACAKSESPVIAARKTATDEVVHTFPGHDPTKPENMPTRLWLSPCGEVLVVERLSRTDAYEVSTGAVRHVSATEGHFGAVGFSADGKRMAIATSRFDMGFWETLRTLTKPASAVEYLHITIVDIGSGEVVTSIRSDQRHPTRLALSADGRTLALVAAPERKKPQSVFVWDLPE